MPRPFAVVGMSCFLTLVFLSYLGEKARVGFAVALTLGLILSLVLKSTRREKILPVAFLSAAAAVIMFSAVQEFSYNQTTQAISGDVWIAGRITELPVRANGRFYYIVRADTVNGIKNNAKIRVSSREPIDAPVYSAIEGQAEVFLLGDASEDALRYYKSTGVYLGAYFIDNAVTVQPYEGFSLYRGILELKQSLSDSIFLLLPNETGGLITAMLFGDRSVLDNETSLSFRRAGISHITAVSGLHLTVWILMAAFLLERLYRKSRAFYVCPMVLTLLIMALAGFSPSVMRAGFMVLLLYGGKLINAQADSLNSLGLSVFILSLVNPFAPGHVGLQLSFFATLGIVLMTNPLSSFNERAADASKHIFVRRLMKPVVGVAAVTVSAVVFTLPVMMLNFEEFSLVSVPSNIAISAAAGPAMFLGAAAGLFYGVPGISLLSRPFAFFAGLLARYILRVANEFGSLSFAVVNTRSTYLLLWLAGSLLILSASLLMMKKFKRSFVRLGAGLCAVLLLLSISVNHFSQVKVARVIVADIGNASSAWIHKEGKTLVVACGGDRFAASSMEKMAAANGIRAIDLMILPRPTKTETGAAQYLARSLRVERVVSPVYLQEMAFLSSDDLEITDHGSYAVADGLNVRYTYSDNAVCAFANIGGTTILFLFHPGCVPQEIPTSWKSADILVCRALPPADLPLSGFGAVLVSSQDDVSDHIVSESGLESFRVFSTAKQGNLVITTRGGGVYSVGRDRF